MCFNPFRLATRGAFGAGASETLAATCFSSGCAFSPCKNAAPLWVVLLIPPPCALLLICTIAFPTLTVNSHYIAVSVGFTVYGKRELVCECSVVHNCAIALFSRAGYEPVSWYGPTVSRRGKLMGAILELTSYAATPLGMVAVIVIAAAGYFAARWVFAD